MLRNFLLSFLVLTSPGVPSTPPDPTEIIPPAYVMDLEIKKKQQIKTLTTLRRTSVAATIAGYIEGRSVHRNQLRIDMTISIHICHFSIVALSLSTVLCSPRELVVRCVALGYELAASLMVFDEIHLAQLLQSSLVALTAALQTIPTR